MSSLDEMVQLVHFTHQHPLNLVNLKPNHHYEEDEEEEEEEYKHVDDFVVENNHVGQCNMCKEDIYLFHLCYYNCKDCNYSLHKFCAEIPTILQNHPLHPNHNQLTLSERFQYSYPCYSFDYEWTCGICNCKRKNFFNYHCSTCKFTMDIICATMSQQKIDHPSHPHQLQRKSKNLVSTCNACGHEHEGTFYQCTTCNWFWIHQDCALLPTKLLIQQPTNGTFTHSHPLTLTYSFPYIDQEDKFTPRCRICDEGFLVYFWHYTCDKCRYYVHVHCATSKYIKFLHPGHGKMSKNFDDDDHPNLLHCPFPDESYNLLRHYFLNQKDLNIVEENHSKSFLHQHPLIVIDKQTSLWVSLHNPMKKKQLLCDGCVRPITKVPFYKCSSEDCGFVLHDWCARLPSEIEDHPGHPNHTLFLMPRVTRWFFGIFTCDICFLLSNGFGYGCRTCNYYVDINCAFLPEEITHEAHPGHLLSRIYVSPGQSKVTCNACHFYIKDCIAFHCPSCDFYLDTECAFLLPGMIRHKHDKHPLSLRYEPAENHPSDYFCEVCEDKFNPGSWFYHCGFCSQSIHCSCAPVILQCEQTLDANYKRRVFRYINVKFGGTLEVECDLHCLTFVQGIAYHGKCKHCDEELEYEMTFRCLECEYALHYKCAFLFKK